METVHFVNNWNQSPKEQLNRYLYYTPEQNGIWQELQAIDNPGQAKFLVVMDGIPKNSYPEISGHPRKIFFQREPPEIKALTIPQPNIFQGTYDKHYHISTWMLKIPFNKIATLKYPEKTRPLSAVMSSKILTPGQQLRIEALKKIQLAIPSIDIFGRGLEYLNFGKSYKGALNYNDYCKFKGLYGYKYSLAFENSCHDNYFTEKIIDCFLSWTKPIYYGCSNISKYFPKSSYCQINISEKNLADQIKHEIIQPIDIDALQEARNLVLYKYSLWPSIRRIINTIS